MAVIVSFARHAFVLPRIFFRVKNKTKRVTKNQDFINFTLFASRNILLPSGHPDSHLDTNH